MAVALACAGLGCVRGLGSSSQVLTRAEERELGRQVTRNVHQEFRVLDDPYVAAYLASVGGRLESAAGPQPFALQFDVVADPRINAFAVPGGHIFVTSQTVLACEDESELAGVVAHEMGHVTGRHIVHRIEASQRANLTALAAVLAGAFLARSAEAGAAVAAFGMAAAQTQMLRYSRDDEEDADRRGARTLTSAGYDGWGLVRFMETIQRQAPAPEGVPAYLFTHPLPDNRATYLAEMLPAAPAAPPDARTLGRLWRVQARVLAEDPRPWGLASAQRRAQEHPASADAQLAAAVLLSREGRYGEAWEALEAARALAPRDPEILRERGALRLRQGRGAEGIALLEESRAAGTADAPTLADLAWAYLEADDGARALAVAEELSRREVAAPRWPRVDYLRGLALGKVGREGEARVALGDYYGAIDDQDQARRHYREALRLLPAGELRSSVETKLAALGDRAR